MENDNLPSTEKSYQDHLKGFKDLKEVSNLRNTTPWQSATLLAHLISGGAIAAIAISQGPWFAYLLIFLSGIGAMQLFYRARTHDEDKE
ncbi:hypothetical protein [Cerasicoccus frondis]|uniref:hypothetical protein n=1 Tax=Cerasicoccus frondis TaxID=490090 RepID=UPI0028526A72|nr:hypothetical protein [Cerasicoccus frondis]